MEERSYPTNPDCQLSNKERAHLQLVLDSLEYEAYCPLRGLSSAWANASVIKYDEFEITVEIKSGVDSQGSSYVTEAVLDRANLFLLTV